MDIDLKREMREQARGIILLALYRGMPFGLNEGVLQSIIHRAPLDLSDMEIRRELDYLEIRRLVTVGDRDKPFWFAKLTRDGVDVQERTVSCDPGIHLFRE